MNFCYYSIRFSSHGKCISVFGTSSPSFLGNVKIESIRWLVFFFPTYSIGSYHSWTPSPLHTTSGKKLIFLTICGTSDVLFILSFILFKCYFYASTLDSWMFCSAHSLPPFLKGFSKQCWKILACGQGIDIPMVCPKVLCYLKPNWRVSSAVLEDSGSLMKSIVSSDLG